MNNIQYNETLTIPIADLALEGELIIPFNSKSLVIFSHGSGSSRFSERNNFVAKELQKYKISTFLFDLLSRDEDEYYPNRFNIELLSERLILATKFIVEQSMCSKMKVGFFGASTGAASALKASVELTKIIKAIVSRGGRPDLAMDVIAEVKAPTLFIVGELDDVVLTLNEKAYEALRCEKRFEIIPGATHLFEEKGTLKEVSIFAREWFVNHLISDENIY